MTAALLCAAPAFAADIDLVKPDGQHRTLTAADLAQLPAVSEHIAFQTEHGNRAADYAGPRLWDVLKAAGLAGNGPPRDLLRDALLVTGSDGYGVVVAMGEIIPEFEDKDVILAQKMNGQPLSGSEVRLAVPGDRHGGRSVRDVVRIEVKRLESR
ncbi:MAG TPA: molybdopterin-dependent oxidoreductase [Hyphomicrobiales bacterium]|nr:molybdopterin-dependent oxidoreductase [Hyphomicrobiales bacterium]